MPRQTEEGVFSKYMNNPTTLKQMLNDLEILIEKGYGDNQVTIYCKNCDCQDHYNGATGSKTEIQIVINS